LDAGSIADLRKSPSVRLEKHVDMTGVVLEKRAAKKIARHVSKSSTR
jgi:hypothetical protein